MRGKRTRKRIFLGPEGFSERSYGRYLQQIADNHNLPIHIDCNNVTGGGDPLKVVEESIRLMKRNSRNHGDYLVKAIMLDSDKLGRSIDRDNKIGPLAAEHNVKLVYSKPNFEVFLLRHFPGYENKSPPAEASLSELVKVWPEYRKGIDARSIYRQLGEDGFMRACTVEGTLRDFLISIGFDRIFPDLRT